MINSRKKQEVQLNEKAINRGFGYRRFAKLLG